MVEENFGLRSQVNRLQGYLIVLEEKLTKELAHLEQLAKEQPDIQNTLQNLGVLDNLVELRHLACAALFKE